MAAVASDGAFWVSKVLSTIDQLSQDTKHVSLLCDLDDEDKALRAKARELAERLSKVRSVVIARPRPRPHSVPARSHAHAAWIDIG